MKIVSYECDSCGESIIENEPFIGWDTVKNIIHINPKENLESFHKVLHNNGECLGSYLLSYLEDFLLDHCSLIFQKRKD